MSSYSFTVLLLLLFCSSAIPKASHNTVFDDDGMDTNELIDSFMERARMGRHHRGHRAEKEETLDHTLTSVDARGREYVKCRKTAFNGGSVVKRCYLPDAPDMRVGCYAVWDKKSETLVQDCWMQQAISMANCREHRCAAGKNTFCCCYGHNCNEHYELPFMSGNDES